MSGLSNIIKIMVLIFVFLNNAYGCEIHLSKKNTSLIINTTSQCVSFDTKSPISFAGTTPETLTVVSKKYNYPQEGTNCSDAIKYVNVKVLTVAPNGDKLTRPTKDITATTYTGNTVPVGALCEGNMIKYLYLTKSYYKIVGRNETALCGEY